MRFNLWNVRYQRYQAAAVRTETINYASGFCFVYSVVWPTYGDLTPTCGVSAGGNETLTCTMSNDRTISEPPKMGGQV